MAVGRSRLLGNRGDAIDHLPTILYLKTEPNFLTLDEPVELGQELLGGALGSLARLCGPALTSCDAFLEPALSCADPCALAQ